MLVEPNILNRNKRILEIVRYLVNICPIAEFHACIGSYLVAVAVIDIAGSVALGQG